MTQQTWQGMKDFVAAEIEKQKRYKRITDYLLKEIAAKSADFIVEMFPDTSKDELAAMARLGLIKHIPHGKYTVFKESKTRS